MDSKRFASVSDQLTELDIADLRAVISSVFHHASYHGERTIIYSSPAGPALSIEYYTDSKKNRDPKGVVRELRAESGLADDDVQRLQAQLDIIRGPQKDMLASFFHFSFMPVTGWWRYRDRFQLLPPPMGAPLPAIVMADHPFLIEACYSTPDHFQVQINRRLQVMNQLRRLLPVLLRGPIFQPHTEQPVKHWVVPRHAGEHRAPVRSRERLTHLSGLPARRRTRRVSRVTIPTPIFADEYYEVEGRLLGGPELSTVEHIPPMPVVDDHEAYYRTTGISGDEVLEVPAVLARLLDNYFALDETAAKRYLRACYWFNMARFFQPYSHSASLFADVAAVEVMLPGGPPHPCSECELPHHPSITKQFRAFLAEYVPDKPERERFYEMRSQIVHGSTLLRRDAREELGGFYPGEADEYEERRNLHLGSRIALVNWLLAQRG